MTFERAPSDVATAAPFQIDVAEDDPRVVDALLDFVSELEAGRRPDRRNFLAKHADIASTLSECLEAVELVRKAAPQFCSDDSMHDIPAVLGDFQLVRELGRGGMGIVYQAVQASFGRTVALKILPAPAAKDDRQRRRFQIEAQAAALLQHEHIVPIYAVGCEDGIPYYAMPLIEGASLAVWLSGARRDVSRRVSTWHDSSSSTPVEEQAPDSARRPRLAGEHARWVASIGRQVAAGLAHAHAVGIIHRDIKPANLLLDRDGRIWISDFGLAHFADDWGLTRTQDVIGTLHYMSPEQAIGGRAVDHRADLYSLGSTLYELLTLRPALHGRTRQELLNQLTHQDPVHPTAIDPEIPRDLETIILKAMAKEPPSRYSSATEMADDLRRFLADQPIRARRPSWPQRAGRYARRHRKAVAASALAAVILLTSSTVCSILVFAAYHAESRQRFRAEQNLNMATAALARISERVAALRHDGDPARAEEHTALIEQALTFFEALAQQNVDDPLVRERAAIAFGRVADIRAEFGQVEPAREAYLRAIELLQNLAAREPAKTRYRTNLATAWEHLGNLFRRARRFEDAEDAHRRSLALRQNLLELQPDLEDYGWDWAHSLTGLGAVLVDKGSYDEAVELFHRAVEVQEPLAKRHPVFDPEVLVRTADTHNHLGGLWALRGRFGPAEEELERSLSIRVALVSDYPQEPRYRRDEAVTHGNLGTALQQLGKWQEAERHFRESIQTYERLTEIFPGLIENRRELAKIRLNLAPLLQEQQRLRESELFACQSRADFEELAALPADAPAGPRQIASDLVRLGDVFALLRCDSEAEEVYRLGLGCDPARAETVERLAAFLARPPIARRERNVGSSEGGGKAEHYR